MLHSLQTELVSLLHTFRLFVEMLFLPWMHNGLFNDITGIINLYNSGMHMIDPNAEQKAEDSLYPVTDPLLQPLNFSKDEIQSIVAFMEAVTAKQYHMHRPELPR